MIDEHGRWHPEEAKRLDAPEVDAVAYLYDAGRGRCAAVAYHGKAKHADWHFSFQSEEDRTKKLNEWRANLAAWRDRQAQARAARHAYVHTLQVGDVMHYSWGYDQTQAEFYEVVGTTAKMVTLRQIASEGREDGFMCGHYMPIRGRYIAPALRPRPVRPGNHVTMKYGTALLWDGKPAYASWYA